MPFSNHGETSAGREPKPSVTPSRGTILPCLSFNHSLISRNNRWQTSSQLNESKIHGYWRRWFSACHSLALLFPWLRPIFSMRYVTGKNAQNSCLNTSQHGWEAETKNRLSVDIEPAPVNVCKCSTGLWISVKSFDCVSQINGTEKDEPNSDMHRGWLTRTVGQRLDDLPPWLWSPRVSWNRPWYKLACPHYHSYVNVLTNWSGLACGDAKSDMKLEIGEVGS